MRFTKVAAVGLVIGLGAGLAACGGGSADAGTIKVVYETYGAAQQLDAQFKVIKAAVEKAHPTIKVQLVPVVAPAEDYFAKVQLMQRSASTAPDVVYEDSFYVNSDAAAGYLAPLDDRLKTWPDWQQFIPNTKKQGQAVDGKTYGVPMGSDTRGLWLDKRVFAKAGIPATWQPKTWDDVLNAARTIKAKVPGAIPLNLRGGKPNGEEGTMQNVEMLMYGTASKTLYDPSDKKWLAPNAGMLDALRFNKTVFDEKLGPTPSQMEDPQYFNTQLMPMVRDGKVGMLLDGSWLPQQWQSQGGSAPWPDWAKSMGMMHFPTQHGQAPGKVTLAGGWTLAIGSKSTKQDAAWTFISTALNKENALTFDNSQSWLPVRTDVAADPRMVQANSSLPFWSGQLQYAQYRPTLVEYPKVSLAIQNALDAVINGTAPQQAADDWTKAVRKVVKDPNTKAG